MRKLLLTVCISFFILLLACDLTFINQNSIEKQVFRNSFFIEKESIPADFIPHPLKISAIGDSLTVGYGGNEHQGGYLAYLKEELSQLKGIKNVEIDNNGVTGIRSAQLLNLLNDPKLINSIQSSQIVMITTGGNDIMRVVEQNFFSLHVDLFEEEQSRYENYLHSIIKRVRDLNPNIMIVLIGIYNPFYDIFPDIPEVEQIVMNWNKTSQSIISQYENSFFVEIEDIFYSDTEVLLYEDHFHPNEKGYELIAEKVLLTLTEEVPTVYEEWFVNKGETIEE